MSCNKTSFCNLFDSSDGCECKKKKVCSYTTDISVGCNVATCSPLLSCPQLVPASSSLYCPSAPATVIRGPTGPRGATGATGATGSIVSGCADFFAPNAAIAGIGPFVLASATPLTGAGAFIGAGLLDALGITLPSGSATAPLTATGLAASGAFIPTGTIVPVNISGAGTAATLSATSPFLLTDQNNLVVYDPTTASYRVTKSGLYEVTYYLQGTFQGRAPEGLTFGAFNVGSLVSPLPQSITTANTPVAELDGDSFNISKTFCVALRASEITSVPTVPLSSSFCAQLPAAGVVTSAYPGSAIRFGIVYDPNDALLANAASLLFDVEATGVVDAPYAAAPAGTFTPNNAFEVTFKRIGEFPCEQ